MTKLVEPIEDDEESVVDSFLRDYDGKFSSTAGRAKALSKVDAKLFDAIIKDAEFNESDHPRDSNGKFGSGGGSSQSKLDSIQNEMNAIHAEIVSLKHSEKLEDRIRVRKLQQVDMYEKLVEYQDEQDRQKGKAKDAKLFDSIIRDVEFNESEHPRDQGGKFSTAPGGPTTEEHFKDSSTGKWHPDREAIHEKALQTLFAQNKAKNGNKEQPKRLTAHILGGGSASGKSTSFDRIRSGNEDIMKIDSDWMKKQIPEYAELQKTDPQEAAARVHEESSVMAKKAMARAVEGKINFVLDSTGSGAKLPTTAKHLHEQGYDVHAVYIDLPVEKAIPRAQERGAKEGRNIPRSVIEGSHAGSAAGFMRMKDSKHVKTATAFNNDVNKGEMPILIYERKGKEEGVVVDNDLWQKYRRKAGHMNLLPAPAKDAASHPLLRDLFETDNDIAEYNGYFEDEQANRAAQELLNKHAY